MKKSTLLLFLAIIAVSFVFIDKLFLKKDNNTQYVNVYTSRKEHLIKGVFDAFYNKNIYIPYLSNKDSIKYDLLNQNNEVTKKKPQNIYISKSNLTNYIINQNNIPKTLSPTMLVTLYEEPEKFYNCYILRTKKTKSLDYIPNIIDFSRGIYNILSKTNQISVNDQKNTDLYLENLIHFFNIEFNKYYEIFPYIKTFWLSKFKKIAENFINFDLQYSNNIQKISTGNKFEYKVNDFDLQTSFDKIEFLSNGKINLVKYTFSSPPSQKVVEQNFISKIGIQAFIINKSLNVEIEKIKIYKLGAKQNKTTEFKNIEKIIENQNINITEILNNYKNST